MENGEASVIGQEKVRERRFGKSQTGEDGGGEGENDGSPPGVEV